MSTFSVKEYQSNREIILTSYFHIVKTILNNLDNSHLLKCKSVCSFWRKIADIIMSERIMIITRNMPYQMTRKAVTQPELVQCLGFQRNQNMQLIVEFNLNYILDRNLGVEDFELNEENFDPINCKIRTQIAVFPSVPGVKVQRFLFDSQRMKVTDDMKINHLTELINVPKEELKCVLWFSNRLISKYENIFPNFGIPSLILSTSERLYDFEKSKHCGITFSGKRMNVVLLKIIDEKPFHRIKSKFMNEIKKVKDYNLEPFKCVALMFNNQHCPEHVIDNILFHLKETFPHLPVLLFFEMLVFDMQTSDEKYEDNQRLFAQFNLEIGLVVIRIILIWVN